MTLLLFAAESNSNNVWGAIIALLVLLNTIGQIISARSSQKRSDKTNDTIEKTKKETVDKIEEVKKETTEKIEEVRKTTDGIIPRLVAAGKIEATQEERDRVEVVAKADTEKEAEIIRRVEEAKTKAESQKIMTTTNGQEHSPTVAANVSTIKTDVKTVKGDVSKIKTEVTREVSEGVKQGISDAKKVD